MMVKMWGIQPLTSGLQSPESGMIQAAFSTQNRGFSEVFHTIRRTGLRSDQPQVSLRSRFGHIFGTSISVQIYDI
jgi:hypothetical protein